ncbi:transposase [Frigidibacter sp. ROC022]|uniref:transposase n=1 Tax=Frigidibacter sp. ROC022 TaxID=2971796 RepID=UPI003FCCDF28
MAPPERLAQSWWTTSSNRRFCRSCARTFPAKLLIYTGEAGQDTHLKKEFAHHDFTSHGVDEYFLGDVHTNTIEVYFSIFKRGMRGVYQHCGRQHLHRYTAEFEFRCNTRTANGVTDTERAALILKAAKGKRLTYRRPDARASS